MVNEKLTIFIVDDDDMYLQILKQHIEKKFEAIVYTYTTSEICLTNLHLNPDIIILDYTLNSYYHDAMDGLEMLKEINLQNKDRDKEIFSVMLTKQDDIQVAAETMKNGAFDYIIKGPTADKKLEIVINNIQKQIQIKKKLQEAQAMKKIMMFVALFILALSLGLYFLYPKFSN
jgi:DNA-binding NtrC family response regulator